MGAVSKPLANESSRLDVSTPRSASMALPNAPRRLLNREIPYAHALLITLELLIIAVWCVMLVLDFRNTSKYQVVGGADIFTTIQGRFFWDHVRECGVCALWNGDARGGAPAYVDANVDIFHPIVAIPAYLFGTLQGAKVTIPIALFLGALSVWWLALELGTGTIARVSTAMMMAASGAMIGRLQEGLVVLVTATSAAVLVLPALIRISKFPTRRNAGILAVILGMAVISGQGYVQLGLVLMSPLVLILLVGNPIGWRPILVRLVQSAVVGLLVAAVFVFPFLRVYQDFGKVQDVTFAAYQPMKYLTLNLAISDYDFMESEMLEKTGFAAWYAIYIGWIAIAFAIVGFGMLWRTSKRMTIFLACSFVGALWVGSGVPYRLMADSWFATDGSRSFAWSVRIPSFAAALAIPPLLGFSAIAIDTGVHYVYRPTKAFGVRSVERLRLPRLASYAIRLCVIALIVFSLRDLYHFGRGWIWVAKMDAETANGYVNQLRTSDLAWVSPLHNDAVLQLLGMDAGLKYSDSWRSWALDDLSLPPAFRGMHAGENPPEGSTNVGTWGSYYVFQSNEPNQYATSTSGGTCAASGVGGDFQVHCNLPAPGRVVVQENNLGSWNANINGIETPVAKEGQWIAVDAPSGDLTIEFRYRPWDFWVGLAGSLFGLVIALIMIAVPSNYRFSLRWNIHKLTDFRLVSANPKKEVPVNTQATNP